MVKCLLDNTPLCKDVILIIEDYRISDYSIIKKKLISNYEGEIEEHEHVHRYLLSKRHWNRKKKHYMIRDKVFGEGVVRCLLNDIKWFSTYYYQVYKRVLGFQVSGRYHSQHYTEIDAREKNIYYLRHVKDKINFDIRCRRKRKGFKGFLSIGLIGEFIRSLRISNL